MTNTISNDNDNDNDNTWIAVSEDAKAIEACLQSAHLSATVLHGLVCDLFIKLRDIESMRDVLENEALRTLFGSQSCGIDRRKVAEWAKAYSPLRVRWHDNGRFKDVIFSSKAKKLAEASNEPVWNTAAMRANHWDDFESVSNAIKKAPKTDEVKASAAKMLARSAYEAFKTGKAPDIQEAITRAANAFILAMQKELTGLMSEEAAKGSFEQWCKERDVSRQRELQLEKDEASRKIKDDLKKAQEKAEKMARLNATIKKDEGENPTKNPA